MAKELIKSNIKDNVATALKQLALGDVVNVDGTRITVTSEVAKGHKLALVPIAKGEEIVKFGLPIARAAEDIEAGGLVHFFNMEELDCSTPDYTEKGADGEIEPSLEKKNLSEVPTLRAYRRKNGDIGIRNYLWAVITADFVPDVEGIYNFRTKDEKIIRRIRENPDAGALLILAEGANRELLEKEYGDDDMVVVLDPQDRDGIEREKERLSAILNEEERTTAMLSDLRIAIKCGKENVRTSIVANAFLSAFSDEVIGYGGTILLTETDKLLNAAENLLERASTKECYEDLMALFERNSSRRRKKISKEECLSGISNVREESYGCIRKAGSHAIRGVVAEGSKAGSGGLYIVDSPTSDEAIKSALYAGAQIMIYSDDMEERISSPIPVIRITSYRDNRNSDFSTEDILYDDVSMFLEEFFYYLVSISNGRSLTDNEKTL